MGELRIRLIREIQCAPLPDFIMSTKSRSGLAWLGRETHNLLGFPKIQSGSLRPRLMMTLLGTIDIKHHEERKVEIGRWPCLQTSRNF
jgi:hypothetical protein